jgi:SAM-dependent methyltransferase
MARRAASVWPQLLDTASAPYRSAGRFAWRFARGKLGLDPVFRHLLQSGLIQPGARVLDIGCGQGLLASLLQACAAVQQRGAWPTSWPVAASATAYTGIELMARDVRRAQTALATVPAAPFTPQFVCADMCTAALPACDVVVILDVLHYVDHAAQLGVLTRVRGALAAGNSTRHAAMATTTAPRLLLRVGDAAHTRGFAISQWVDRVVTTVRGHRVAPTWGRTLPQWVALLQGLGFVVHSVPQSQGTPFANVLLVADLLPA